QRQDARGARLRRLHRAHPAARHAGRRDPRAGVAQGAVSPATSPKRKREELLSSACASGWCGAGSVHVRVGAEVLEDLLALFLVDHHVHPVAVVALLGTPLRLAEQRQVAVPVLVAAALAAPAQRLLARLAQPLEQFVLQAQEELAAARVALP